jgi:hypothetical protein
MNSIRKTSFLSPTLNKNLRFNNSKLFLHLRPCPQAKIIIIPFGQIIPFPPHKLLQSTQPRPQATKIKIILYLQIIPFPRLASHLPGLAHHPCCRFYRRRCRLSLLLLCHCRCCRRRCRHHPLSPLPLPPQLPLPSPFLVDCCLCLSATAL